MNQKERHPPGLAVLFLSEMWERFGFYTLVNLLVLYLTDPTRGGFGWTEERALVVNSYYLMFVYASPLIGGWLADLFLGYRWSVILGGLIFMVGYFLLGTPTEAALFGALALIVTGNGFFKPNVSAMVGQLYPENSSLKDRAFLIFYMGINVGAFFGPLVGDYLLNRFGSYRAAFLAASAGMVFPVILLTVFRRQVEVVHEKPTEAPTEEAGLTSTAPTVTNAIDQVPEWKRIGALVVIFSIVIVFWMVFHQNAQTLVFWARDNTDWSWVTSLLGQGTSGAIAGAINPFWVVTLTFPLVWFWSFMNRRGWEPSTPTKIALGMMLTAASFFFLAFGARLGEATAASDAPYAYRMSPWWLVGTYFIVTLGELMLSPMGLSLVSKVAPIRMRGLMMGGWFLATAVGNKLTAIGVLWNQWSHSDFFLLLGGMALVTGIVLIVLLRPLKKAMPGV
jgi:POT family proton-dependent oligopeptide transporter